MIFLEKKHLEALYPFTFQGKPAFWGPHSCG